MTIKSRFRKKFSAHNIGFVMRRGIEQHWLAEMRAMLNRVTLEMPKHHSGSSMYMLAIKNLESIKSELRKELE